MGEDKNVYWDDERKMFYWIEWQETGNSDIPHRHYIQIVNSQQSLPKNREFLAKDD